MSGDRPSADVDLLSLCAILRWFDRELLHDLSGCDEGKITALLTSDLIVPAPASTGGYHLRTDVQADVWTRLHAERPLDALTLHTRAFTYFLRRMERADPTDRRILDEACCLYHLGELRLLLAERLEWRTIAGYIAAVRAAGPRQARHLHLLSLGEGLVAIRTQDYDRGEAILTALLERADLENDIRVEALKELGNACLFQTRYDRALAFYQRSYALAHQIGDRLHQGLALLNMGMVYNELEQYEQALDLSIQSLHIFRELRNSSREAHALYEVGNNAMYLGRWQVAQKHFQEAIRLYETLGVEARLIILYWSQGFLQHLLGNERESEAAYLRALPLAQSPAHGDAFVAMDTCVYLGFLYSTQGRYDAALACYEQATALASRLRHEHRVSLIHYQRGNVYKRQGHRDEALAAYQEAIASIESLRGAIEAEDIKIGLLGTTQQVYEAMVLLCLDLDRPAEAFDYVERARSRAFLDVLARKSPELYDAVAQPVATLAEVQARLPEGALLLEYFTTGVLPRGEHLINMLPRENARLREHLALPPHTLIFAVTRDRFEVHRAALEPNTLRPLPGDPGPGRRLLRARLLAHLYEHLIGPVRHLLGGRELLYLIPHGPLHYVPFMALRSADGEYLLDAAGPAIALAPSATILLRNCLGRPRGQAAGMLALGYNDQGEGALRYAEAEARHVARLMGGVAWTGAAPKSRRLIAEGGQARWLHIAGHAVYNPRDPLDSALRLGTDDALSARTIISELNLQTDLVTLSACTSGLSHVVPGDELLGLQRAFLYAGAPAVVCTLWEAADFVALLVMDRFYADLRRGRPAAAALRDAQVAVREMTGRDLAATIARWRAEDPAFAAALGELPIIPAEHLDTRLYADPFYWAPFMLIGRHE